MSVLVIEKSQIPEIIERMKKVINVNSDADLAKFLGLSETTVSKWKKRERIPEKNYLAFLNKTNVNPDWLLTGEGEMYRTNDRLEKARELLNDIENNHKADVVNVPFYEDIYASAGAGAYNETVSPTNNLTFSTSFLKNMLNILDYTGLHIITAVGDSMQPTICDGDRLFVLPLKDHNINDGGVYVISTPFGVLVKRVYIYPVEQRMILHSDNPEIKDEVLEGEVMDKVKFIGRVVGILRNRI